MTDNTKQVQQIEDLSQLINRIIHMHDKFEREFIDSNKSKQDICQTDSLTNALDEIIKNLANLRKMMRGAVSTIPYIELYEFGNYDKIVHKCITDTEVFMSKKEKFNENTAYYILSRNKTSLNIFAEFTNTIYMILSSEK